MTQSTKWKQVAGGVFETKMPWGGKLTMWEGPSGRCYSAEMQEGSIWMSMGFDPTMSRADIVQRCIENNAESHARDGFPDKVERERLQRIQRREDERRAQENYPAALTLLRKARDHQATTEEITAFLDYDEALQKVGTAKVEKERTAHLERQKW